MYINRFDDKQMQSAYGILCQSLFPNGQAPFSPPFGMTYCSIEPNGQTSPHDHYDGEVFLILSGHGEMRILNEVRKVNAGDLIHIPNHSQHELRNLSSGETLKFVSLYWDEAAVQRSVAGHSLIYSAPPTPNGRLHVGHLSGPYFAADAVRRYLRLRGATAVYCCGADENQSYVPTKARQLNRPGEPLKVAQEYTEQILSILDGFSANPDIFIRPHADAEYRKFITRFFTTLAESGKLVRKNSAYPFCGTCDGFVHESNVSGNCPHCGEKTNGNGCEACGLYNDCRDLKNPVCNVCGTACDMRPSERYVFPLGDYRDKLRAALAVKSMPPRFRRYAERLLKEGLQDVTVTYTYNWGIPAPAPKEQVIYEWLEMAGAYLYEAQQASPDKQYQFYWNKEENKTLLAFGFDNSFFYMALVPALMWGFDKDIRYPDAFLTNFFYQLDGKKFSTSRNHAVWGDDILAKIEPDALRLFLAATRPEAGETNFTLEEFRHFLKSQGSGGWDETMARIRELSSLPSAGESPAPSVSARHFIENWQTLIHQAEMAFRPETLRLNTAVDRLTAYRQSFNEYLEEAKAVEIVDWRVVAAGLKGIAQIFAPICPEYSTQIFKAIDCPVKWSSFLDLPAAASCPEHLPLQYFTQQLSRLTA